MSEGFTITGNKIIKWASIIAAVVVISTAAISITSFLGPFPHASAQNLKEVQERIVIMDIDNLNRDYDRLLERHDRFVIGEKPLPQSLKEQIRDKCRAIRSAGGSC